MLPTIKVIISGKQGVGKTTLANAIAALCHTHGVEVELEGNALYAEDMPRSEIHLLRSRRVSIKTKQSK